MLLTDEEIHVIADSVEEPFWYTLIDAGARAQLKKVYDWGQEDCPHDTTEGVGGDLDDLGGTIYWSLKKNCDECWQSLLDEVKE